MNAPPSLQPPRLFITRAPRDVRAWAALFDHRALPVLARTAAALEDLRAMEDAVDAHMLADVIDTDPLMTLKLLAHVAHLRRGREGSEVETVTEALVMLGIPPFFNTFGPQETAEDRLAGLPRALDGFNQVLRRSHRAARFAIGFAVHRMDHDAPVIHEAALLHDFAELLLWLHAPSLALRIAGAQEADAALRTSAAQQAVLNVELVDLQHALMQTWRLPGMLVRITDDHAQKMTSQLRNVLLAIHVARHSADGWDNAALPDDVHEVAELLQLSHDAAGRLLLEIDCDD
jgi:HD-like signal output (HDOD) protein